MNPIRFRPARRAAHRLGRCLGRLGTLNRLGAAVVEAFQALLPGQEVDLVQVALVDVRRQEDVQRLGLADVAGAVVYLISDAAAMVTGTILPSMGAGPPSPVIQNSAAWVYRNV